METLPDEILELIVQQLTPQDLARCSAVCREWRDIFNRDCLWKPLCDPELEEPLRTIPCVATPAFVAPEAENSTLPPNCHWKLAFMRENHLWKNWGRNDYVNKKESIIKSENQHPISVEFLSDTLIVAWYFKHIEILDVSVMPPAFVAKTDISVESCSVIGPNMFLVAKKFSLEVFSVDILNKSIDLTHFITLDSPGWPRAVKEHFYFCVNNERTKLIVFDLSNGKLLKEEPFPVVKNRNENVEVWRIISSPTSDLVAVAFQVVNNDGSKYCEFYIFSLKKLAFLPGPVANRTPVAPRLARLRGSEVVLHGHWMVIKDCEALKVYNLLSQEVCNLELNCNYVYRSNNGFILWVREEERRWLKSYSPLHKTLTTICEMPENKFEVMNNKVIAMFYGHGTSGVTGGVLKPSGRVVECGASLCRSSKINNSFTKALNTGYFEQSGKVTWYITYLW